MLNHFSFHPVWTECADRCETHVTHSSLSSVIGMDALTATDGRATNVLGRRMNVALKIVQGSHTLFVGWLLNVPCNMRICSDNFTRCHTEIEVADQTFHLTLSQYTDTGPTSPSTDPRTPGAWQGSHWSANFLVTGVTRKISAQARFEPGIFRCRGGRLNHCATEVVQTH